MPQIVFENGKETRLKFGDIVVVAREGAVRAYMVVLAAGTGKVSEGTGRAFFVNLETGDTRAIGDPVDLNTGYDELVALFKADDIDVLAGEGATLTIG